MEYRVIIAGSRSFTDYKLLAEKCLYYLRDKIDHNQVIIVSGAAKGADSLGERFATEYGFKIEQYPADWGNLGRAAGPMRNKQMAEVANALICFWDGKSRGTKSMIQFAKEKGLDVRVVQY